VNELKINLEDNPRNELKIYQGINRRYVRECTEDISGNVLKIYQGMNLR